MPTFDLKDADVRELNQALHDEASAGDEFKVVNPNGKHSVAVGAMYSTQIDIEGHVGYYCAGMNQQATVTVHGNAGSGVRREHDVGPGPGQGQRVAVRRRDRPWRPARGRGRRCRALRHLDEGHRHRRRRVGRPHERVHGAERAPGGLRRCRRSPRRLDLRGAHLRRAAKSRASVPTASKSR